MATTTITTSPGDSTAAWSAASTPAVGAAEPCPFPGRSNIGLTFAHNGDPASNAEPAPIGPAPIGLSPIVQPGDADGAVPTEETEMIVHGIPLGSAGMSKMFGRVIIISVLVAVYRVVIFIHNLLTGSYERENQDAANAVWAAMSSLLIDLSIPACGYCGAIYGNRQLTCCFCTCNLFVAIVMMATLIRFQIYFSGDLGDCNIIANNESERQACEDWVSDGPEKYFMLISGVIIICLGGLGFWFGNVLFNRLSQGPSMLMTPPTPVVGEVVLLRVSAANVLDRHNSGAPFIATVQRQGVLGASSSPAAAS